MASGVFAPGVFSPGVFGPGAMGGEGGPSGTLGAPLRLLTLTLARSNRLTLTLAGAGGVDPLGDQFLLEDGGGILLEDGGELHLEGFPAGARRSLVLARNRPTLILRD